MTKLSTLTFAMALLVIPALAAEPQALDLSALFAAGKASGADAKITLADGALRVDAGHRHSWPGVNLAPPDGKWDWSAFGELEIELKNLAAVPLKLTARVDNKGADGTNNCVNGRATLQPGETGLLRVTLRRSTSDQLGGKLFGMRGYPVKLGAGHEAIDPSAITQLLIFLTKETADHSFAVRSIRPVGIHKQSGPATADADPFLPFVDLFGQYRHRDWPGKIHSQEELQARVAEEARELREHASPAAWNAFGGWKEGPQLRASGFFRAEKQGGAWWLVDPEGQLFFSLGLDSVRLMDATVVQGREHFFTDFPAQALPEFFIEKARVEKGHYAWQEPRAYSFAAANLRRKYGEAWRDLSADVLHQRLRSWGINTLGMWSDAKLRQQRRTPYTDGFGSWGVKLIEGSTGYWGKFPDPFDPSLRSQFTRFMAERRGKSAGDPWCIGYFSDNEMSWGDDTSLALAALQSPAAQPAKREFLADLTKKYGEIAKLNFAWGTQHASWEALLASTAAPDAAKARPDLVAFYSRIAEEYFKVARSVIKEVAPDQLYLGCRFAWGNPLAQAAAAKFCDVVSFNLYYRTLADFTWEGGADVPLIVGEFHFGALDRGMFHGGLVPVADQQARAAAYTKYVTSCVRDPRFVGCHWFEYQDEPLTGRIHDEENFQIGFVDVADTPYREMVEANRKLAASMYRVRSELSKH